jgi:hypothetical protein
MNPQPAPLPHAEIRAAVGDHPAGNAALRALQSHIDAGTAEPSTVREHVSVLRGIPASAAIVESWFESAATQHWLSVLSNIGL